MAILEYGLLILLELLRCDPEASLEPPGGVVFDDGTFRGIISGPVERMKSAISLVVSFLALASRGSMLCLPFADERPLPGTSPLVEADNVRGLTESDGIVGPRLDNEPCCFEFCFELTGGGLERRPFIPFIETTERPAVGRAPRSAFMVSLLR